MNYILELKKKLNSFNLEKEQKKNVLQLIDNIEAEFEQLSFTSIRYKRDQRVNENFVKKTVELLEKSNDDLKKSNDILIETNNKLSKSNIELERFAHIASHDLKRFSGFLKHNIESNNNEANLEYLSYILEGGKRMNNLIRDILNYSKLSEESNDAKQIFSLHSVIEDILFSTSQYLAMNNAKVEILTPLPHLNWSRSKIIILFKNLIENGIKYNKSNTPIVKIYAKQDKLKYSVFVEDNGIGIKKDYFDKIFEMFTRLHNHIEYEGTGLGLATCNKIVTEFNGEINIRSHLNVKTIFKIDFPIQLVENMKCTT